MNGEDPLDGNEFKVDELLKNIPEFVFEYISKDSENGHYTYASESCEEIYGCTPKQLLENSRLSYERIIKEDRKSFIEEFNAAMDNEILFSWQGRLLHEDFRLIWIQIKARPIRKDGNSIRWYGVVQDITAFKTLEHELEFARDKARREAQAREDFLATMSHDIRTPLGGILGMTDLLMHTADEQQMEYLNLLKYAANNLSSLVNNILDFSRLNSGEMVVNDARMSMGNLLKNLLQIHQFKAHENGNNLNFDVDPKMPDLILADEMVLTQILNNLLSNALKFTRKGAVTLRIELLEQSKSQARSRFTVEDTGVGMSHTDLEKVFDKFTQVGKDRARNQGSGLGLTIAKKLVELLGGQLHVSSKVDKGTSFHFEVDLKTANSNKTICLDQLKATA